MDNLIPCVLTVGIAAIAPPFVAWVYARHAWEVAEELARQARADAEERERLKRDHAYLRGVLQRELGADEMFRLLWLAHEEQVKADEKRDGQADLRRDPGGETDHE